MNPFDMAKNLAGLQDKLNQAQAQLADIRVTGSSGGNMVKITLNGKMEIVDMYLDPICVDNRDIPMLQDLIKAAHHSAMELVMEEIKNKLGPMASGLNIPGMNF